MTSVTLVRHNPAWAERFASERARIEAALGDHVVRIEHVGSTSIPDIVAKPIVDIAMTVRSLDETPQIAEALDALGYEYVPEYEDELPNRRYFRSRRREENGERPFHLHVYAEGDSEFEEYLLFRDHLRAHPEVAREYERLKVHLAAKVSREDFSYGKAEFVRACVACARAARGEGRVVLWEYDPSWPGRFDAERERIAEAIGEPLVRIEHVGSTAVKGVCTKPIIDMAVEITAIDVIDAMVEPLARLGYAYFPDWPGFPEYHKFFMKPAKGDEPWYHLHVYPQGQPEFERYTLFRDWLRTHPRDAVAYDALKRDLAARLQRGDYTRSKAPFIDDVLTRARAARG